jgi:subtilisin family serine protease
MTWSTPTRSSDRARSAVRVLLLAGALAAALAFATEAAAASPRDYIVVFRDTVADPAAKTGRLERAHGFASRFSYAHALKGFAATLSAAQVSRLRADGDVAFASEDRAVHAVATEPLAPGDSLPTGVRRIEAGTPAAVHEASTVGVAVIDTGIDLAHPDLNAVAGKSCLRQRKSAQDDNGHGTHVAGTIAARNNGAAAGESVAGVSPGTRLYAVKVLSATGSGTWSQVICGVDWVTKNAAVLNIKVANMSLGGGGATDDDCGATFADALHRAVCNATKAGVTFVVAAGNSGQEFSTSVPAVYSEVLTVTAASDSDGLPGGSGGPPTCRDGESDDAYATFSNFADTADTGPSGFRHVIAGPGVCIRSTWLGGGYRTASGTSMATPHVAGAVALCLGSGGVPGPCAGLSPAQIIDKLRADAAAHASLANGFLGDPLRPVGPALLGDRYYGHLAWAGVY